MAAPFAVGVAALYKQANGDKPAATIRDWILSKSVPGVVKGGAVDGTPNRLLNSGGL